MAELFRSVPAEWPTLSGTGGQFSRNRQRNGECIGQDRKCFFFAVNDFLHWWSARPEYSLSKWQESW